MKPLARHSQPSSATLPDVASSHSSRFDDRTRGLGEAVLRRVGDRWPQPVTLSMLKRGLEPRLLPVRDTPGLDHAG
eukprot:1968542-Pleurochrysis_carterae.AAC.1